MRVTNVLDLFEVVPTDGPVSRSSSWYAEISWGREVHLVKGDWAIPFLTRPENLSSWVEHLLVGHATAKVHRYEVVPRFAGDPEVGRWFLSGGFVFHLGHSGPFGYLYESVRDPLQIGFCLRSDVLISMDRGGPQRVSRFDRDPVL